MLDKEPRELLEFSENLPDKYLQMNYALVELLEEYSLVSFAVLDIDDESTIEQVLVLADHAIQYGENLEPEAKFDMNDA